MSGSTRLLSTKTQSPKKREKKKVFGSLWTSLNIIGRVLSLRQVVCIVWNSRVLSLIVETSSKTLGDDSGYGWEVTVYLEILADSSGGPLDMNKANGCFWRNNSSSCKATTRKEGFPPLDKVGWSFTHDVHGKGWCTPVVLKLDRVGPEWLVRTQVARLGPPQRFRFIALGQGLRTCLRSRFLPRSHAAGWEPHFENRAEQWRQEQQPNPTEEMNRFNKRLVWLIQASKGLGVKTEHPFVRIFQPTLNKSHLTSPCTWQSKPWNHLLE